MNLTDLSLRRPVTIMMIFTCLVVLGAISTTLVPLEFMPDMDEPDIDVNIPYPGSSPEEIEELITRPVEEVLATISGIKEMSSWSDGNGSNVEIVFDWGEDTEVKALEAKEKVEGIRHLLPSDVERIFVRQESSSDFPILNLRISSDRDLSGAYEMLNRNVKRRVERLEGISRVELYGVAPKEIRIELDADRIAAHRLDMNELAAVLRGANFTLTAGRITDGARRYRVRPMGELTSVDDLRNLVVGPNNLRLTDVATVLYESPEMDHGRHLDRKYAIGLEVNKEGGANTVETTNRVIAEIEAIGTLPEMRGINIYFMDNQADGILSSLEELLKSGILGAVLAFFVLYFFLRRLSTTLIVAVAVPFSLLVTMSFLYFLGMTLNILSMMGLMLAVGMLVDNAVVVTESIHRHQLRGEAMYPATRAGVKEVALAVTAGTLTTAIVFLPGIVSARDEVGIYLSHVATTICIALGASLLISLTVIPLLAVRVPPITSERKATFIDRLLDRYERLLGWTLRRHRLASLGILLVLASVAVPQQLVEVDMFEDVDDRRLRIFYNLNGNYTIERVEEAVDKVEEYLYANQEKFEIRSVYSYYRSGWANSTLLLTEGEAAVRAMADIREDIRDSLPSLPIADLGFEWQGRGGGGPSSVMITLAGESTSRLMELAEDVAWALNQSEKLTDARSDAERGEEEIRVRVDRQRARQYGFSTEEVANAVATAMRGQNLRRFRGDDGEVEVRVQFEDADRQTLDHLRNLSLFTDAGQRVALEAVAGFQSGRGPHGIWRLDRQTRMGVRTYLADGVTMGAAREEISAIMSDFSLPPGYSWDYGRGFHRENDVFNNLMLNILLALVLIYFLMAGLFESLAYPAAIWTSILFAVVGVFWFFLATGTNFSIMAMIGILILIGVVVNNGIVLIDHINGMRARGHDRETAIRLAGRERLRPILMTAGTTVLGLLPLCFGTTQIGGDGPPYFPMARAIVGGLAFSTIVTLVMLPTIYIWMDDLRNWSRRVVMGARGRGGEVSRDVPTT